MEVSRHWRLKNIRYGKWEIPMEVAGLWQKQKITMSQALMPGFWEGELCKRLIADDFVMLAGDLAISATKSIVSE
jgi:hypothetical protein